MDESSALDRSRRLGRGLGALITSSTTPLPTSEAADRLRDIPLDLITTNPLQPRREFPTEELHELQESIRANGLLQPVTVRAKGNAFELVAGERRLRAVRGLGWPSIPAVVRDVGDTQLLTLALVENLQREDLNPIEEAGGYRRLIDEFSLSQQQVAEAVGKERSTVANLLRLLNLPLEVQEMLRQGRLSEGHARALLSLPTGTSVVETARQVVSQELTVRDVERLSQQARPSQRRSRSRQQETSNPEIRKMTDQLRRYLQTDVEIMANEKARGELRIRFYSADDLNRLMELITGTLEDSV